MNFVQPDSDSEWQDREKIFSCTLYNVHDQDSYINALTLTFSVLKGNCWKRTVEVELKRSACIYRIVDSTRKAHCCVLQPRVTLPLRPLDAASHNRPAAYLASKQYSNTFENLDFRNWIFIQLHLYFTDEVTNTLLSIRLHSCFPYLRL